VQRYPVSFRVEDDGDFSGGNFCFWHQHFAAGGCHAVDDFLHAGTGIEVNQRAFRGGPGAAVLYQGAGNPAG